MSGKLGYGANKAYNNSGGVDTSTAFSDGFNARVKNAVVRSTDNPFVNGTDEYERWGAGFDLADAGKGTTVTPPVYIGGSVAVPADGGYVPNLIGLAVATADTAITTAGFIKGATSGAGATVLTQSPLASTTLTLGEAIDYTH